MKNMVLATVLGLLLFGTQVPAEASTLDATIGSQVEVVNVMHHQPHHGGHGGWHDGRRNGGWNPPPPQPPPRRDRHGWHDHRPNGPHFPSGRRW